MRRIHVEILAGTTGQQMSGIRFFLICRYLPGGPMKKYFSIFLLFAALLPLSLYSENPPLRPPEGISQEDFNRAYTSAQSLEIVFRAVYENVRPSVVGIVAEHHVQNPYANNPGCQDPYWRKFFPCPGQRGIPAEIVQRSQGTGFIIDDGQWVVTNHHVVGQERQVQVKLFNGRTLVGTVRGVDTLTDIALIQLQSAAGTQASRLGNSDAMHVGDFAIAVGNPFGLDGTYTTGVVSAVGRSGLDQSGLKFIQTDASINQGNSGGPLINLRGEVIGINRMIFSPTGGSVGIGFAIPINEVRDIIRQLKESGSVSRPSRPFLGISMAALPAEYAQRTGGKGILVVQVVKNSAAAGAGIQEEDIILKVDQQEISEPEVMKKYVAGKRVGDRLTLEILRGSQRLNITVALGAAPQQTD